MRNLYFILDGTEPIEEPDILKWAEWMETTNRKVEFTKLPGDIVISTVFLGINQDMFGYRLILFETLVVGGQLDHKMWRYSTWKEAEFGHKEIVKQVKLFERLE